ncbi:MAG: hypothetical protein WB682_03565, partial [Candidatus Dormiibacterota bacterium]
MTLLRATSACRRCGHSRDPDDFSSGIALPNVEGIPFGGDEQMEYRSKQEWRGIPLVAVSLSGKASVAG